MSGEQKRQQRAVAAMEDISAAKEMMQRGKVGPDRVVLAMLVDGDGRVSAEQRDSMAFQFRVMPWNDKTPGAPDKMLTLAGQLVADEARSFLLAISITTEKASLTEVDFISGKEEPSARDKVLVVVVRKQHDAPSMTGRLLAAKLWSLVGENIHAPYQSADMEAVVLGTRLIRSTSPAMYTNPGKGSWILLRIYAPGEAFLAIDLESGQGEFFPKRPGETTEAGRTLFRAL